MKSVVLRWKGACPGICEYTEGLWTLSLWAKKSTREGFEEALFFALFLPRVDSSSPRDTNSALGA